MNIYVGNLPYRAEEEELRKTFEAYGEVSSVNIIKDKFTGESRGFGFVVMASDDDGQAAIDGLNGQDFGGRRLNINVARSRDDRD
jgi:RNA recognition motif-containing protein